MGLVGIMLLAMVSAQKPSPPPPPILYHPQAGPHVVHANDVGELQVNAKAIFEQAVSLWSADRDDNLGAFLLCFRSPARSRGAYIRVEYKVLTLTAEGLIAAGARVVTIGTEPLCNSIPRSMAPDSLSSYPLLVEIHGVLQP